MEKRSYKRIQDAKSRARPEISRLPEGQGWNYFGFAKNFDHSEFVKVKDNVERVDVRTLTPEEFFEKYEKTYTPIVLTHTQDSWDANHKWTVERLKKRFRNQRFKCGEDDKGTSVKLKMKYYTDYLLDNSDDSPLYIFDSGLDQRKKCKLLNDYTVPDYFADDLFRYASERRRPPYRWFVYGPACSGTGIHIDPLGTSAWNALVKGHKRWCLLPTCVPKENAKPRPGEGWKQRDEAVTWFRYVYPRVVSADWPDKWRPVCSVRPHHSTLVRRLDGAWVISNNSVGEV